MEPFAIGSNFREFGFRDRNNTSGENNPMHSRTAIVNAGLFARGGPSRHILLMRKGVSRYRNDPG
ncbi:hypothetical protein GGD63_006732 [Bradyrhizobium sp. cir1]|nr:hypothetical protein [Bradyrhizobium sp. cir1]